MLFMGFFKIKCSPHQKALTFKLTIYEQEQGKMYHTCAACSPPKFIVRKSIMENKLNYLFDFKANGTVHSFV